MNESNDFIENHQLYLKLPVEIWIIILNNLNHDSLIIMDQLSFVFNKYTNCKILIKNILLDRQINYSPRITGKCIIYKLPKINGIKNINERNIFNELGTYDLYLLLKYFQKTRTDLVKYDIIELDNDMISLYAIFDGDKFILDAYYYTEYMSIPIDLHIIIKNNIPFSYWGDNIKYFKIDRLNSKPYLSGQISNSKVKFNYNDFIDECIKNITIGYLENKYSIYTYFIYDNNKTYIICDENYTIKNSQENLTSKEEFKEILLDKEYFKTEELYIKSEKYDFPNALYLKM